jgi:hypothetical protein
MSSSSSLLLKAFNKHFFQFMDDMIQLFPENENMTKSRAYLETMKTANPTVLVKIWHKFIYTPYHEQIEQGDLTFFFEKDYSHDLCLLPNSEQILNVIDTTLRDPLRQMSETNMDMCRKHFQLVTTICAKYIEAKG